MLQALFYKEWIKTRKVNWVVAVIFAALIAYTFINTAQMFRIGGAVMTWNNVILKDMPIVHDAFKWLPLLAGLFVGFAQFVPEMINKRLKLTLHLPLPEVNTIAILLFYGLLVLSVVFLFTYIVLSVGLSLYYPYEIIVNMTERIAPWFVGGLVSYLLVGWVCIEPVWRQRLFNVLISLCLLSFFYIGVNSGSYNPFLIYLIFVSVLIFSFPFYSTIRFKEGAQ